MVIPVPGRAVPSVEDASRAFMRIAERSTTLYQLSDDYLRVLQALELEDEGSEPLLEAELERIGGQITQKAEAIAGLVVQLDGMADLRRAEAKRLRERAEADERHAVRLRTYLMSHMALIGSERIDTARFTVAIRANPPSVEVLDQDQVPEEFRRVVTTVSVDKRAVLEHYKASGEIVDGVEIVRRQRLDIR